MRHFRKRLRRRRHSIGSKWIEPLHAFFMGVPDERPACPFLGCDQGGVSHAAIPNSYLIHTDFDTPISIIDIGQQRIPSDRRESHQPHRESRPVEESDRRSSPARAPDASTSADDQQDSRSCLAETCDRAYCLAETSCGQLPEQAAKSGRNQVEIRG